MHMEEKREALAPRPSESLYASGQRGTLTGKEAECSLNSQQTGTSWIPSFGSDPSGKNTTKQQVVFAGTDQHGVVTPVVPGVERGGHQPLQQRHAQAVGRRQLRLDHRAQLTGVSRQHDLGRGQGESCTADPWRHTAELTGS